MTTKFRKVGGRMNPTCNKEKEVGLRLAQEGWEKCKDIFAFMLGENFKKMPFISVEEFFSARGQTRWLRGHIESVANPNTDVHFFLRQVRGLLEAFELNENLSLPEIFEQAAALRTTLH